MADVFSKSKRSQVMSRIRSHSNKGTELALISLFRANGIIGWRRRFSIFGKPDFVFPKLRLAVFVDGCFWHCCPKHGRLPKSNDQYWHRKLANNRRRDRLVVKRLRRSGWTVIRVWERALKPKNAKLPKAFFALTSNSLQKTDRVKNQSESTNFL
jgi:DNA mismatch endonuclease (patch repair protein)